MSDGGYCHYCKKAQCVCDAPVPKVPDKCPRCGCERSWQTSDCEYGAFACESTMHNGRFAQSFECGLRTENREQAAEIAKLREVNAGSEAACKALVAFQQEYERNTKGNKMPGNEFYCRKLMAIVAMAKAALEAGKA